MATHLCPRCNLALVPHRLESHHISYDSERCPTCGGVFLGALQLNQVEHRREDRLVEFARIPAADAQQAPLKCPNCAVVMEKQVSSRDEKVVMDYCPTCKHTWLDGGELEAIRVDSLLDNARALFRSNAQR